MSLSWLRLEYWQRLQKLVPNVWQLVFANVAIEGGVLYTYGHCFLDSPGLALDLLVYYVKLIGIQWVPCGGAV